MQTNLGNALHPWLNATNSDRSATMKLGAASSATRLAAALIKASNDHHFHYGYFLYAAACMAKDNPTWVAQWG